MGIERREEKRREEKKEEKRKARVLEAGTKIVQFVRDR